MNEIKIMVSRHSAFYSPVIALMAKRFLEKEGLSGTYQVLPSGSSITEQVASAHVDLGQAAVSLSWPDLEKADKPSVAQFAQINTCDGFFIAAREPDSNFTWDKLENGTFMYVHGGQPEAMLRYGAFKMGLDLDEIQGISKPSTGDMMDSWRKGEGDFFHEQGSYPQQLEYERCAYIVASVGDAVGPVAFSSLICRWEWLETDAAKRFSHAYRASREWVNTSDPEEIAQAESSFFPDHSAEAVAKAIGTYQQMGTWTGDIAIPKNLYENALNVFEHAKLISQRYPYEKVVVPPP